MLQKVASKKIAAQGGHFAIIASRYNARYVDAMLRAGGKLQIIRVPGAFEIPVVAARLARGTDAQSRPSAIICLGVILRGATTHAQHIGEAVSDALMQIQV